MGRTNKVRPFLQVRPMRYLVRPNLSYCVIDGCAIFLDVDADRYFLLPDRLERAFLAYACNPDVPHDGLRELADLEILTPSSTTTELPRDHIAPRMSALELPPRASQPVVLHVPEVWADVWRCRRMLKTELFRDVLDAIIEYREKHDAAAIHPQEQKRLLQHTDIFRRARLHVPIAPRCLLDSLALTRFLARRQHRGDIVFGVTREPFTAHCWVQAGDLVLNDTLGSARAHTAIRVV